MPRGEPDHRFLRVAPVERDRVADSLDGLGAGTLAHPVDPGMAARTVGAGHPDLDQFMGGQRAFELVDHGIGQTILADPDYGAAVMGTSAKKPDLPGCQHDAAPAGEGESSLPQPASPFDEVKIDLGAIVVVAGIGAPAVMWWLDGPAELVLLGGYGCGAALWLYCRTRGVLAAAHASRMDRTGGPEQE